MLKKKDILLPQPVQIRLCKSLNFSDTKRLKYVFRTENKNVERQTEFIITNKLFLLLQTNRSFNLFSNSGFWLSNIRLVHIRDTQQERTDKSSVFEQYKR